MSLKSVYCLETQDMICLINLNSLHIKYFTKQTNIKDIINSNELKEFSQEECYLNELSPRTPSYFLNPHIVLSYNCNYSCTYCYQKNKKNIKSSLVTDDLAAIDEFYNQYCEHYNIPQKYESFHLVGGEPLLPENHDIINAIDKRWPYNELVITTNGTYLNEFKHFLKKRPIRLRVSIDGTKEMHLTKRIANNPEDYDKMISGIQWIANEGIQLQIITVFHPEYIDRYSDFFDQLQDIGWPNNKIRVAFIPVTRNGCNDIDIEYLDSANKAFAKLKEKDLRAVYVDARKLVPGTIALTQALTNAKQEKTFEPYRCSCLISPNYTFVPNGEVMICQSIDSSVGCIGHFKPSIDINFNRIDKIKKRRVDQLDNCKACIYKVFCIGGCIATSIFDTNDIMGISCGIWNEPKFLKYMENVLPLNIKGDN